MILVTGGLGMIGAHTAQALADSGHDVVVTSHRRTEVPAFLEHHVADRRIAVEQTDVTDGDAVVGLCDRHRIDGIVHLAGTMPGEDPVEFFRHETTGLLNVLDAARRWRVRRLAVASSLGVYAGRSERPWHEQLDLSTVELPHLIVAFKKAAETLVLHGFRGTDVQPVVLRIGSIWGPLFDPYSPFEGMITYTSALLRGEQPPTVYADDGGDACYAPDAGRAIALLMTTATLRHEVYNVSSGVPYTYGDFVRALQAADPSLPCELLPGRSHGSTLDPYLDISRLCQDTGFVPAFDLDASVAHYLAWRAKHDR